MLLALACAEEFPAFDGPPKGEPTTQDSASTGTAETGASDDPPDSGDSGDPGDTTVTLTYPDRRVGMFYLAWHAYAASAWSMRTGTPQTVEAVIAGDGDFADLVYDAGLYGTAQGFHYHQEPTLGFYCLYRQDADSTSLPDCPDIETVTETHATQLWEAGVDFVYVDLTNLPTTSEFGDVLGLRPLEVLFEEWGRLRRSGVPTPQIAGWVNLTADAGGAEPMVGPVLDVYAAAEPDLVFAPDGVPALFYVHNSAADPSQIATIAARGVTPVPLWGNLDTTTLDAGVAGWMQPCTEGGAFTTLVSPGTPCNQGVTHGSPLGTVVSVSRSYQVGYASLPFQASGRLDGLTFQKQMETAFTVQPDVLLINAWNEHIAQPQANPYDASYGALRRSMGVTDATGDSADWLWVDMYGSALNRDFEPTVEDGGAGYALLQSCLRVWRSGATSCDDGTEACCQLAEGRTMVYSVRSSSTATSGDHVPTVERAEVDSLVAGGWTEACNPFYGPPGLCGDGTGDGPFQLYPSGGAGRVGLYRCYSGADHFITTDGACEGRTYERLLGYAATAPSSDMPRSLRRCLNSASEHLHWLDAPCPDGVSDEGILGYVR